MRSNRRRTGLLVALGTLLVVVVLAGVAIYTPRVADHFGYVTPLMGRLPVRISYAGRHYLYTSGCANQADLQQLNMWPLAPVGGVPILFGGSRPLLSPPTPAGLTRMALLVATGSCYRQYSIEGGP
ncbi:MAG TPA: hypothetical protein VJN88_01205 [Ktedonobacterales bacterium]|nr:hypothetical protein [Ktedonobacterales bacterium]